MAKDVRRGKRSRRALTWRLPTWAVDLLARLRKVSPDERRVAIEALMNVRELLQREWEIIDHASPVAPLDSGPDVSGTKERGKSSGKGPLRHRRARRQASHPHADDGAYPVLRSLPRRRTLRSNSSASTRTRDPEWGRTQS